MSDFNGFREGCPGLFRRGIEGPQGPDGPAYITHYVKFQASGKKLEAKDAGIIEPDAIRVIPVDDYEGPVYRDSVYAFSEEEAAAQRARQDSMIPEGHVHALDAETLEQLDSLCGDCKSHREKCPVLEAMILKALSETGTAA